MERSLAWVIALLSVFALAAPVQAVAYKSSPLDECKLQETQNIAGASSKGFPSRTRGVPNQGTVKMVIVPYDYLGNEGTKEELDYYFKNLEKNLETWSRYWSKGKMVYEVVIYPGNWIRVNSPVQSQDVNLLAQAADPFVDFSETAFFFPFFPPTKEIDKYAFYGEKTINTQEGNLKVFSFVYNNKLPNVWAWVAHEALHPQGFIGHGPANGSPLGLLMNQDSMVNSGITSWESFVHGWWGEQEILCLDASKISKSLTISLGIMDKLSSGFEAAVIKLSHEEAIVVERRGPGPFSKLKDSLTAYKLNVNKPVARCDECQDFDRNNWWQYLKEKDNDLYVQKSVTDGPVTITNLGKGKVRISVKW